jgi:hypothetical protein
MILNVHADDGPEFEIGDEIWQQSLADAIRSAAEFVAVAMGQGSCRARAPGRSCGSGSSPR